MAGWRQFAFGHVELTNAVQQYEQAGCIHDQHQANGNGNGSCFLHPWSPVVSARTGVSSQFHAGSVGDSRKRV